MEKKRRRIALSCIECRRRKVQCDRNTPACTRCRKAGMVDKCAYVPYEVETLSSPRQPALSHVTRECSTSTWVEEAEDYARIASGKSTDTAPQRASPPKKPSHRELIHQLEQKVADLGPSIEAARSNQVYEQQTLGMSMASRMTLVDPLSSKVATNLDQVLLRGRSFKTQYYGPSHFASILLHFDELSTFIKDITIDFSAPMFATKNAHAASFKQIRDHLAQSFAALSHEHSTLLMLVPDETTAGMLVQLYMGSFEITYRVLHVPTFCRQYKEFWRAPHETPTSFLVILLLVMAVVQCVSPQTDPDFLGRSSRMREKASESIAVCDSWLQAQSCKHVTLVNYQVRVLLCLAKRMNAIKIKRAWTSVGELLCHAQAAGLHREPASTTGKISVFDQEMRRRLWATILELNLLAAMENGMPVAVSGTDWDCQPPANIHDEEFHEHSQILPPSRSLQEFTRTSYLCISNRSAPLRIDIVSTINRVKPTLTFEIATSFDLHTRQALAEIPSWPEIPESHQQPSSRLAKTLAKLQLLELTILTHQPFATANDNPARQFFSRAAFRDAAANILELYKGLTENDGLTLRLARKDAFRAGLCVCYDLCTDDSSTSSVTFDRKRAIELLEHALDIQEYCTMQLGHEFHAFWITSSALSLVYSKQACNRSPNRDKCAQESIQRVMKLHDRIVARQVSSIDGLTRTAVVDQPVVEAETTLVHGDGIPGVVEPVLEPPAADNQFDFSAFNIADVWNLFDFHDIYNG